MKLPKNENKKPDVSIKDLAKRAREEKIKKDGFNIHEFALELFERKKAKEEK